MLISSGKRKSQSAPSLRCSRRENILKASVDGFLVRDTGKSQPPPTRSKEKIRGHPLIETRRTYRGNAPVEQSGKYRNQDACRYWSPRDSAHESCSRPFFIAKPPSTVSSSSAIAASKPLPAWLYPPALVSRPNPPRPPDAPYDPPSPSPSQSQPPRASTYLSEPSCPPQKSQPSYTQAQMSPSHTFAKRNHFRVVLRALGWSAPPLGSSAGSALFCSLPCV